MAIDTTQVGQAFQPSREAQEQAAQSAQASGLGGFSNASQQSGQRQVLFSFSSGTGFEDIGSLQTGSAIITHLKKAFEEKYKDTNTKTMVIPFLRESFGEKFRYSSIITTASSLDAASGTLNVAYHILLVEGSNPVKPENYRTNTDRPGQQVNLPRFACDGIDSDYITTARGVVERAYRNSADANVKRLNIIYANAEVIPDTFRHDDPEKVGSLAANALIAVVSQLKRLVTRTPFNLAETEVTPFTIEHTFRDGSVNDLNDMAVRSDVIVRMTARSGAKRNTFGLNGGSDGTPVSTTSLFMDLMYTQRSNTAINIFGKQDKVEPCFVPRAVVTNSMCYRGFSLEMYLLQLYAAHNVYDSGAFKRSLISKSVKKGDLFDMTDIGALNVLANINNEAAILGTPYSTRAADVTDSFKYGLLQTVTQQIPLLAIDCQIAGPSSWQTAVWQKAAEGGKEKQDAYDDIVNAAMNLTDGEFSRFFSADTPIVAYREIVPMGQWQDNEGTIRDLREFDTLAILNRYGNEHPEQIAKWVQSQSDVNRAEELRLTDMISIIEDASGYRAKHTGRAVRVTLHPLFMAALRESIKLTKHTFTSTDTFTDAGVNNLRGVQFLNWSQLAANPVLNANGYNRAGLDSMVGSGLFNQVFNV